MLLKIEEEREKREEVFIFLNDLNDLKFVYNHLLTYISCIR